MMKTQPCKRLRVLFVSDAGRVGGAEVSLSLLVRHLRKRRLDVAMMTPREALPSQYCIEANVRVFPAKPCEPVRCCVMEEAMTTARAALHNIRVLAKAVHVFRPTIIHVNTTSAMLGAGPLAYLNNIPVVWHVRDFLTSQRVMLWCAWWANAIVAVSESLRRSLMHRGSDARKVEVIYNGVEVDECTQPADVQAIRCVSSDRRICRQKAFVYLNVGQYVGWKRQELFLHAAAQVIRVQQNSRFVVVGGSPRGRGNKVRTYLKRVAHDHDLADVVRILGWQDDMSSVLRSADVLVHTARHEPFGRVLIEAMAAGLPVVAPDDSGPAEIIEDKRSGFLFPPEDVWQLAACMEHLQSDSALRERFVARARNRVTAEFTAEVTAQRVERVYRQLLDGAVFRGEGVDKLGYDAAACVTRAAETRGAKRQCPA